MLAPRYSPWNRIVSFALGAGLITSAFYAVVLLALGVARSLAQQSPQLTSGDLDRYALWVTVLTYPPVLGWLVYCRHFLDRRSVRSLGVRWTHALPSFVLGALGGALAITWLFGAMWLCGAVVFGGSSPEAFESTPVQIAGGLASYAALFAAVGLMEELIFRGYLLHNLAVAHKLRGAVWVQSILFALIHLPNAIGKAGDPEMAQAAWMDALRAMPSLALIGAIFALMWAKTGTLWPSIGFHFAWNFCLGCVFSLPVSGLSTFRLFDFQAAGSPWLSGGTFGAEGSILLWPILLGAWWILSRLPDHPQATRDLSLLDPRHPATLSEAEMALLQAAQIAQIASREPGKQESEEAAHESRFRTSMRPRQAEAQAEAQIQAQAEPQSFPIIGQLPRQDEATSWTPPTSAPASASPFAAAPGEAFPRPSAPVASETIFSPLPFQPPRATEPAPMPGGVADPTLDATLQPQPADSQSWQFQPLPEPAAPAAKAQATPQVLAEPEAPAPIATRAHEEEAPQVLAASPQPAPAAPEQAPSEAAPPEAIATQEAPAEAPRPRRPSPRW